VLKNQKFGSKMRFLGVILYEKHDTDVIFTPNASEIICWKGLNLVDSNGYVVEEGVGVWLEKKPR
jgi:hypothetical protein